MLTAMLLAGLAEGFGLSAMVPLLSTAIVTMPGATLRTVLPRSALSGRAFNLWVFHQL